MKNLAGRLPAVMATALLAIGAHTALAQPGGHGHHGRGDGFGVPIERMLYSLKGQLNLNTVQQLQWDNAVAQARAAREAGHANRQAVRAALQAELAKAEPDLAAVAAVADDAQAKNQALRRHVRAEWLNLYATFTPAQKGVVAEAARQRLSRFDDFRARMKERMRARQQGS